jgi:quercetin dioxygenase-like cupin family protein
LNLNLRYLAPAVVCIALATGCSDDDNDRPRGAAIGGTGVTRALIQSDFPATAPGQELQLTRVVIPAGMDIAPHTHPGPQLATIVEGTLSYTIIRGEVQVTRHAGTSEASRLTATAGQTVELNPGDALLETPGMVHTARNAGGTPVVIYLSSLFPAGAPASSPAQ